jgi:hypothetical protein
MPSLAWHQARIYHHHGLSIHATIASSVDKCLVSAHPVDRPVRRLTYFPITDGLCLPAAHCTTVFKLND